MGLKAGEKVEKLGEIHILSVTRERLYEISKHPGDTGREGFPLATDDLFIRMFCQEMHCEPGDFVTRIEFEYV